MSAADSVERSISRHDDEQDWLTTIADDARKKAYDELERDPAAHLDGYEDRDAEELADMLLELLNPTKPFLNIWTTKELGHAALDSLHDKFKQEWVEAQVAKAIEDAS